MYRVLIFFMLSISLFADYFPLLPMMYEENSIFYDTWFSGASALPDKSGGALLNPAATNQWHIMHNAKIAGDMQFFSLSDDYFKTGAAVTASVKDVNYVGGEYMYRGSRSNSSHSWQRGTIMYGGQLAAKTNQGAVHWGASLSYYNHKGNHTVASRVSGDSVTYDYTVDKDLHQNLFAVDIGFYQAEVFGGLAFSFVFENLMGAKWTNTTVNEYIYDTLTMPDSLLDTEVIGESVREGSWSTKEYSTILLGVALTVPLWSENVIMNIPFDTRFWGWMNGELRNRSHVRARIEYHSGLEIMGAIGSMGPRLAGRFGWAYKPESLETDYRGKIILNDGLMKHYISGGIGIEYKMIRADALFRKGGWGVELTTLF